MAARSRPRTQRRKPQRSAASSVADVVARNPIGLLFLMTLFLLIVTGAYWHANGMSFNFNPKPFAHGQLSEEAIEAIANRHVNRKFIMGGIQLGMTADTVKSIYPDARQGFDRHGEPVMTMRTSKGILVAWLFKTDDYILVDGEPVQDRAERVYRLRLDEAFSTLSEQQIVNRYAREYGRPIEAACARAGLGDTARCTYSWWGGDGIEVQAIAKKKSDLYGQDFTQLTTIATNTIKVVKPQVDTRLSQVAAGRRWGIVN